MNHLKGQIKRFLQGAALLMVLGTSLSAMAADYVLTYTNNGTTYYVARNNTTGVIRVTSFDPATCIWSCASNTEGTTAGTLNNNNTYGYLYQIVNGTRYFLSASTAELTIATSVSDNYFRWRTNGTYVYNRYNNNTSYYINLANGVGRNTTANTASNAIPNQVTTPTSVTGTSTNPTVNGNDVLNSETNYTYTATGAAYQLGYINYRFINNDHYFDQNGNSFTGAISASSLSYSWALSPTQQGVSVSGTTATGTVSVTNLPESDVTLTITVTVTATGGNPAAPANTTLTGSKTITLQGTKPSSPIISVSSNTITLATTAAGSTSIRYTLDGSDPTATTGTVYDGTPLDLSNSSTSPVTIKAVTVRGGTASDVTTQVVTLTVPEPVITINPQAGTATIACANSYATVYYTTDGSEPSSSNGNVYSPAGISGLSMMQKVKAIAILAGWNNSPVVSATVSIPSGVSGSVVTLNDLEDHTWTYYSAKPDNDYPDALHSPDPRNVKITYLANGYRHDGDDFTAVTGVQLSYNESANTFVYYETIEKTPGGQILTGNYPYKVIPNPFSKRPKNGNTYYGFEGWRIQSGGEYIDGRSNNDILNLEEVIHFVNLDAGYTPNVISAEVVLEAIWAPATVVENTATGLTSSYSYERNFIVCNANISISNLAQNATVSSRYPDGTAYGNDNTTVTGITVNNTSGDIKVEHIKVSGNFYGANNKWLIVGRGCEGEISQTLSQQNNVKFRLESGTHVYVHPRPNTTGIMVMGSDYDRAQGDNSRLRIVNYVTANGGGAPAANSIAEFMDITIKSGFYGFKSELEPNDTYGNYGLGVGGNTDGATTTTYYTPDPDLGGSGTNFTYTGDNGSWYRTLSFYCGGTRNGGTGGIIRVLIEGGELSSLNGGGTKNQAANYDVIMHHIRMKGGWVKGALYGTASASSSAGSTRLVLTGGEVNGWVAGACNGTRSDGNYHGELQGNCFIYVGGNAELRSHNNDGVYNNRWGLVCNVQGGTVFGAGKGIDDRVNYVGSANSTIVSVSDNAYIEQAVYGGAFHGVSKESLIYLTGNARVGNIYGGSFEPVHADNEATWRCNNTDIRMYGGNVTGGIYGGHNAKGTVYQTTSLLINGGQVGVDANHTANIHGGGYGNVTSVSGNVTVTLGDSPANSGGVNVYGNVYGGSALGDVNTNSSNTTIVTLNKGTVNGNLFGGALGEGADVNGKITVTVNGGTVNGNVFGGGDAAAYSPNANFPVVNMTGGQATNVFGGGMGNTAVVTGNPQVTLSGTAHVTGNVYGGGNAAPVTGSTSVILQN